MARCLAPIAWGRSLDRPSGPTVAAVLAVAAVSTMIVVNAVPAGSASPGPSSTIATCGATGVAVPRASGPAIPASPLPTPDRAAPGGQLTVFAAASLRGAFEALEPRAEAAMDLDLVFSFDASSFLRTQIEEGAPADVFASADTENAVALLDAGLATDPLAFACTELTVIVPRANPAGIESVDDLATPGVRIVAAGEHVPVTGYATQLVDALGIAEGYEANVLSREDNVAAVRAKIELGEADAAIVYVTDAIASGAAVTEIAVPPEARVPATYVAVVVADSDQPAKARAFLAWLAGPEGQGMLVGFGFQPAPAPS